MQLYRRRDVLANTRGGTKIIGMQQAESAFRRPGTWVVIVLFALAITGAVVALKFSRHTNPQVRPLPVSTAPE